MKNHTPFLPAGRVVEYAIEQLSTVPPVTWGRFINAVMNIYYCLPFCCRPANPRASFERTDIYRLFNPYDQPGSVGVLAFCGIPEEGFTRRTIRVSREKGPEGLCINIVATEHQMSADLFTRMVMLALHNICGQHFLVHSTAGASSWGMPLKLLTSLSRTGCFTGWKAPDEVCYAATIRAEDAQLTEQLIISSLSQSPGIDLTPSQWETIVALEFRLYDPATVNTDRITG